MTAGEQAFERFCRFNAIPCQRLAEEGTPVPDFTIEVGSTQVCVEVKDIEEDENFRRPVFTRTVGAHVRAKIGEAKQQLQPVAKSGVPTMLLIYNALDPFQAFGTEQHDFLAAMYGDLTVSINLNTRLASKPFHGRNRSMGESKNTSFSAVGAIYVRGESLSVVLYENVFARNPLDYSSLPACFDARRVELVQNEDA